MFVNVLLQDVRHPKVRYTPKLNIESFFHGVWKRTAILVIATNICVTSMPYCWLYIPSHFSSIERINPYFRYWYIYDVYIIVISLEIVGSKPFFPTQSPGSHVFFSTRSSLAGAIWLAIATQVCRDQPLDGGLPSLVLGFSTTSAWPALCIALRQQFRPCETLDFCWSFGGWSNKKMWTVGNGYGLTLF